MLYFQFLVLGPLAFPRLFLLVRLRLPASLAPKLGHGRRQTVLGSVRVIPWNPRPLAGLPSSVCRQRVVFVLRTTSWGASCPWREE